MSRWFTMDGNLDIESEGIASMDECKSMVNGVCSDDLSDQCCSYVDPEYCRNKCPRFQKEDGII